MARRAVNTYSETRRQIVHMAMVGFAFLLRYLTWPQAAALALAALLFNAFALRHIAPQIVRETDAGGPRAGVLFYPLSILVLIFIFPHRLDIVAASWAVMATGDGLATMAGQGVGGPRLPWNAQKTWSGLAAFIIAGAGGGVALSVWVAPSITPLPGNAFTWWAPVAAAVIAAFVETLPIGLDDNISVPIAAAGTLWFATQLNWMGPPGPLTLDLRAGLVLGMPVAYVARRVGGISASGAVTGVVFAAVIYAAFYVSGLIVVGLALAVTVACSRAGRGQQPMTAGRGERRGAGNIIANCLVGTLGAVLELFNFTWGLELTAVWFVAGIAAGASDTVASELGKSFGGRPRVFPTWRRVTAGTPGAISIAGTAAGILGAALIASPGAVMWLIPWSSVGPIVLACTAGAFVESALATTLEGGGVLDNNALNFINTAVAATLAAWWCA
ncbi:MAG: DUF92 domain-containing protein [Acidobacteria bacterium]|nr:DUF92 domain-containing protein [Acidobacteriota bacterium]